MTARQRRKVRAKNERRERGLRALVKGRVMHSFLLSVGLVLGHAREPIVRGVKVSSSAASAFCFRRARHLAVDVLPHVAHTANRLSALHHPRTWYESGAWYSLPRRVRKEMDKAHNLRMAWK